MFPAPYGINGLYNPIETNDTTGATTTYTNTYSTYATKSGQNLCVINIDTD
jgi:hypothetical protein